MFTPLGITRSELCGKGRNVVRKEGKQVLLIDAGERIFAIANRCPHEGYPLSEGTLGPGCVLTCNWHNWKFDLKTGAALVGRDPVRTYPVELRGENILADLSDPPAAAQRAHALNGLESAIADNDMARMARELARLERAGFDAGVGLSHAIAVRNARLEEGMTHAHAAAADWLALAERASSPELRLTALLEPVAHLADDTRGANLFPYTDGTAEWNAPAFVAAVEAEDEARAIALVRGALAQGLTYERLLPVFAEAALAHYADFGHCAIYAFKTGQLISCLGADAAEPLLLSLTRMLVRSTREERLPEFRFYAKALAAWDGGGSEPAHAKDFIGASIDGTLKRALASSGREVRELYDALLGAAAWNLLHFNRAFEQASDGAIADNINWLDFTHALTFANACRHLCAERPDLWPRALLQMALFAGRNRKYVSADMAEEHIAGWAVRDRDAFLAREMTALYDHGVPEPIIACHRVKVLHALEDELAAAPDAPWADAMCAAVNRYLNTPMKRHHGLRTATQARDFIAREA
ncbi:MAG: Rieske 2Fe-2S domain-containing protein [Alphaproteobacteria bacterium]|nr:Rieske 2Fe-2S domain-containing protein [Alphaproteobacteria bacterium]